MKIDRFASFAWGVLAYNLGVILWGAYVRATGSGAGCGSHWPLCNGEVVPRTAELETLIELTHRLTSGAALLAVIGLWVWSRRRFPSGHLVRLGASFSLIFIIIEAVLGAGLVLFELVAQNDSWLRAFSMVAHLINTFILIAWLTLTAWWASGGQPMKLAGLGAVAWSLGGAAVGILLVGGTGAIAALGDTLFPSTSLSQGLRNSFSSESHPLVQLRKFHPGLAILVGGWVAAVALGLRRRTSDPAVRALGALVASIYGVQVAAGAANIILLAPVAMQLFHLLLADLLWITFILLGAAVLADPGVAGAATDQMANAEPGVDSLLAKAP